MHTNDTASPTENAIYALAYQRLTMNHPQAATMLYQAAGDVKQVYDNRKDIRQIMPEATELFAKTLNTDWDSTLRWAENELKWCEQKHIQFLHPAMPEYPQRLTDCFDAPMGMFFLGNTNLNAEHVISVVGTRQSTPYGHEMLHRIITDLKRMVPDVLIISGLAYGIDVCSHKEALATGLDTVGVLAHGLDTMYPASHRNIAAQMVRQGGLLTEYPSQTRADRANFLRRNRIVAGMSDCTIVAESMEHGGSLVTARIANDYGREVFAIPGRITDKASEGCNDLIRNNKGIMLTSAQDIIDVLAWTTVEEKRSIQSAGIQPELFPNLSDEEQLIVETLREQDLQLNLIAVKTGLHISKINPLIFQLEMKGVIKAYAGGTYHLTL